MINPMCPGALLKLNDRKRPDLDGIMVRPVYSVEGRTVLQVDRSELKITKANGRMFHWWW